MSTTPDADGVAKLRAHAAAFRKANWEVLRMEGAIIQAVAQKKAAELECRKARDGMILELGDMDCASNTNLGWQTRIVWMLAEFDRQSSGEKI